MSRIIKSNSFFQRIKHYTLIFPVFLLIVIFLPLNEETTKGNLFTQENFSASESEIFKSEDFVSIQGNTVSGSHTPVIKNTSVSAVIVGDEKNYKIVRTINTTASAYSSTIDQTNSEPFITASGEWVRDGIIAANFLPFGTEVRIPSVFGNKIFVVKDRMNARYTNRIDVWFPSRQQAINFGIKQVTIEIVEEI